MKYDKSTLISIVTDIAQFHADDFGCEPIEEDRAEHPAFIIACFLAQNTPQGHRGVGTDETLDALKLDQYMSDNGRTQLVRAMVENLQ